MNIELEMPSYEMPQLTAMTIALEPVQDTSGGDPSPSNICPISGHTDADVWDDPKYGGLIEWNQIIKQTQSLNPTENNGVRFTRNSDGSITANGVITGWASCYTQISDSSNVSAGHVYYATTGLENSKMYMWYNGNGGFDTMRSHIGRVTTLANGFYIRCNGEGREIDEVLNPQVFDLTMIFGEEKAEEIYAMEQETRGSGAAYFEALFPKDYYAYDSGTQTTVSAVNGDPYRHYPIPLGTTVYGGTLDVLSGVLTVEWENIDSYAGETLPGKWISDRDVYASGTTPTTGAQVAYELATPITVQLTAQDVETLTGINNVWSDSGDVSVTIYGTTQTGDVVTVTALPQHKIQLFMP